MTAPDLNTVQIGDVLTPLEFGPINRATLALYAGASGDHNPIHIDLDFAREAGLIDVFAQGMLSFGVLTQVVTRWSGAARLRRFSARFVSPTQVHDRITCSATVTEQFEEDGETRVRLDVAATAQDGRRTLAGQAVVTIR